MKLKNLRMASPKTLHDTMGLVPGGVTPLGIINDTTNAVKVYLDQAMLQAGKATGLLVHPVAGNNYSVAVSTQALLAFLDSCGAEVHVVDFGTGHVQPVHAFA